MYLVILSWFGIGRDFTIVVFGKFVINIMLKLLRLDGGLTLPPGSGISLPKGLHPFGRGIFLDCEDKRVSRQHGQLDVSDESVTLKALHQNPCFVIKKGSNDTHILKSGSSEVLAVGDKFGVLPNSHWYELTKADPSYVDNNTEEYANVEVKKEKGEEPTPVLVNGQQKENGSGDKPTSGTDDEAINFPEEPEESNGFAPGSPSLLGHNADTTRDTALPTTSKRPHSPEAAAGSPAKQARTTSDDITPAPSEDVKPSTSALDAAMAAAAEPVAGSSAASPAVHVKQEIKEEPEMKADAESQDLKGNVSPPRLQVPVAPVAPGRERCMYGAQCYRRNPQHKLAFSHPSDADWGPGSQGECPWGAGCTRRDPRHWRDHTHPPGVMPPAAPGPNRGDGNNSKRQRPPKRNRRRDSTTGVDVADPQGIDPSNVVRTKRRRKPVKRNSWSGSESENDYDMDDPFMDDGDSDEWVPSDEDTPSDYTQSQ